MTKTTKLTGIATASLIVLGALAATVTAVEAGQRDTHRHYGSAAHRTQVAVAAHGMLAAPQPPSIACVGPDPMRCVIKADNGIARVRFVNEGPAGRTDVFSRSYRGCPTEVTVSWDSNIPVNNSRIVQCVPKPVFGLY